MPVNNLTTKRNIKMTKNEIKVSKKVRSTTFEKIKLLGLVFAVMTPFLYMFGYYYINGYLEVFGLNNEYFLREFDFYLIKGYESIILIFQGYLIGLMEHYMIIVWLMLFIGFLLIVVFILVHLEEKLDLFQQKSRVWFEKHKHMDKFFITIFLPIVTGMGLFLVPLLLIIMLYIPYIGGYYQGKEQAIRDKQAFISCNISEMNTTEKCIEVRSNKKTIKGLFIAKTPNAIALWTSEGLQVVENNILINVIQGKERIK